MRPFGVTILSILALAVGFFAVVTGAILIFSKDVTYPIFVKEYGNFLNESSLYEVPLDEETLKNIYDVAAYTTVIFGCVYVIAGFGLFLLKEWGRVLAVIIAGFNVVYSIFLFFVQPAAIVEIVIHLLIIWYLMKPDVREKFTRKMSIEERILGNQNP